MKVYTVAHAPIDVLGSPYLLHDVAEVHLTLSNAEQAARRLARTMPGTKICIVEGEIIKALRCEPLEVVEEGEFVERENIKEVV
jgi:hypothetical protein